jgi:hypothetical protein
VEVTDSLNGNSNLVTMETVESNEETALQKNEDESYTFRYNLKKGQTYPFQLVINMDQNMNSNGNNMRLQSSRTVVFDYFVEDVNNNQFTIKATFNKFAENSRMGNESIGYDTSLPKPTDQQVADSWVIYKAVTGEDFNLVMDNKGKVHSVTGLDKIINNVMSKIKSEFNAEEQKQIKEMLDYSLSREAIAAQFEESLNIFPDKSLKVGEKWEDSQNINEGPVKGQANVSRTFKEIKDGKAVIEVKGTQNVSSSQTDQNSGITMQIQNKATVNGSVSLDFETGWISKAKITKTENVNTVYSKGDQKETDSGTQTIITTVN